MADVCIAFSPDGNSWYEYFCNYLCRVFPKLNIVPLLDSKLGNLQIQTSEERLAAVHAKVIIAIVSPCFLQFLAENTGMTLRDVAGDSRGKVMIFLCGTILDDFAIEDANRRKVADRLPKFNEQNILSHEKHNEMLQRIVKILEPPDAMSLKEATGFATNKETVRETDKPKANNKRKRKSKDFELFPKDVLCEGTSIVTISLSEPVANEELDIKVEVEIEGDIDADGPTKIAAIWHNPYTYSFVAPDHRAGVAKMKVFLQGKLAGNEELTYSSPLMDVIAGIHQFYVNEIDELCDILNCNNLLNKDVEKRLTKILRDENNVTIPICAFEQFHKVYRYLNLECSSSKLPTLFHLAAKYGLTELGRWLTSLPDARHSYCTYNVDGRLPEEIARSQDHPELAEVFENFREGDTFQQLYDNYLIMKQGQSSDEYNYVTPRSGQVSDSDNEYEDVPEIVIQHPIPANRKVSKKREAGGLSDRSQVEKIPPISISLIEDMENPYECRFQKLKFEPVKFFEASPMISKSQQELLQMMESVKNKELTMTDAEVLFKEWQLRYQKKPASVKQKEIQLAKIRQETEKTHKEKKDLFSLTNFRGKKGISVPTHCIPEIMPGAKKLAVNHLKPTNSSIIAEVGTDRASTASSSSRESTCSSRSRTSTTSGIDIEEAIQEEDIPKLLPKPKADRRKSTYIKKLEEELQGPKALKPPAIPPRTLPPSRPSIPLPKIEAVVNAPQGKVNSVESSPELSYVDYDSDPVCPSTTSDDLYLIFDLTKAPAASIPSEDSGQRPMTHQISLPETSNLPVNLPRKSSHPTPLIRPEREQKPAIPIIKEKKEEKYVANPPSAQGQQFRVTTDQLKEKEKLKKVMPKDGSSVQEKSVTFTKELRPGRMTVNSQETVCKEEQGQVVKPPGLVSKPVNRGSPVSTWKNTK